MLNKVKLGYIIAGALMAVKAFLPDIDIPEGFQQAIVLIVLFFSQFFIKETRKTVGQLTLK